MGLSQRTEDIGTDNSEELVLLVFLFPHDVTGLKKHPRGFVSTIFGKSVNFSNKEFPISLSAPVESYLHKKDSEPD